MVTEEIGDLLKYTDNIDFVVFGEIVDKNETVGALFREITSAIDDVDDNKEGREEGEEEGVVVEQPLCNMVGECSVYVIVKRSVSITVKTLTGREHQLFVNLRDTVGQLKERLSELTGYQNESIRLINLLLQQKRLNPELKDDDMSLGEYFIRDQCIVYCLVKLRRG